MPALSRARAFAHFPAVGPADAQWPGFPRLAGTTSTPCYVRRGNRNSASVSSTRTAERDDPVIGHGVTRIPSGRCHQRARSPSVLLLAGPHWMRSSSMSSNARSRPRITRLGYRLTTRYAQSDEVRALLRDQPFPSTIPAECAARRDRSLRQAADRPPHSARMRTPTRRASLARTPFDFARPSKPTVARWLRQLIAGRIVRCFGAALRSDWWRVGDEHLAGAGPARERCAHGGGSIDQPSRRAARGS